MEVQGLTNQAEYDRIRALTKVTSPDAARKIAGFLNKVSVTSSSGRTLEAFWTFGTVTAGIPWKPFL